MKEIEQTLTRIFDRHRIVFWYDRKRELREEFDAVALPEVEKIALENNEFGVKYRILREEPKQKFLLYHEGPPPADLDNWLLDVQLAQGQFRADQVSLWLSEIGLGLEFADVVEPHADFFQAVRRREALKEMLEKDDTPRRVRLKMLAVCARWRRSGLRSRHWSARPTGCWSRYWWMSVVVLEARETIEATGPIESAITWLLLKAYRRRLRALVATAPAWVSEEIVSASERIGDGRAVLWMSES